MSAPASRSSASAPAKSAESAKSSSSKSWDAQARGFDLRAGLPERARSEIIEAVLEIAQIRDGDLVLEVGAGTGELGSLLASREITYVGLDASAEMLRVFHERAVASGITPRLEHADAAERWPVGDGGTSAVFGSRSLHWLHPDHVVSEAFRVGSRHGAVLLVGRVQHDPRGPQSLVRRRLHELLRAAGHEPRSGGRHAAELARLSTLRGAAPLPRRTIATFVVEKSTAEVLEAFRSKQGLGGISLSDDRQRRILDDLAEWTARELGPMDARFPSAEEYTIEGARLYETASSR